MTVGAQASGTTARLIAYDLLQKQFWQTTKTGKGEKSKLILTLWHLSCLIPFQRCNEHDQILVRGDLRRSNNSPPEFLSSSNGCRLRVGRTFRRVRLKVAPILEQCTEKRGR